MEVIFMNSRFAKRLVLISLLLVFAVTCCEAYGSPIKCIRQYSSDKKLNGIGFSEKILANAKVTVYDLEGKQKTTSTDKNGFYSVDVTALKEPLLVDIIAKGTNNCNDCSKPRGTSVTAIVCSLEVGVNTANVNPLTDKIVSDVALKVCSDTSQNTYLKGPQGLVDLGNTSLIDKSIIESSTVKIRGIFERALKDAGLKNVDSFDPLTYDFENCKSKRGNKCRFLSHNCLVNDPFVKVLSLIHHNRGYDSATGIVGSTMLLDPLFRPISDLSPLDFKKSQADVRKINDPSYTRVFVAGDSTASNYDVDVAPRKGWGQVLQTKFADRTKIIVINAAQSGRSSRSFINEGWLDKIKPLMKRGDYLLVQFGHNDEKCGGSNPARARDPIDIANLATYPNDAEGNIQGSDALSFQRTLEKYITLANSKKVKPILITPVTRAKTTLPVTKSTHITSKGLYYGDYSQTIRDTAADNNVTLVDLDAVSIKFINSLGNDEWKQYWLAVDPAVYPYYAEGVTGNINNPDTTHFQEKGALKVCDLIIGELSNETNSTLTSLKKLKNSFKK